MIYLDKDSEFYKVNGCPISVKHMGNDIPFVRWVLFYQISKPDLLIKLKKSILLEIIVKTKKNSLSY